MLGLINELINGFNFNIVSAILNIFGLGFDLYGVFKLFEVEPIHIDYVQDGQLHSLMDRSNEQTNSRFRDVLNRNIKKVNDENKKRAKTAKKYRKYILIGFGFQLASVIVSLITSLYN
jgi:hypothetical protein